MTAAELLATLRGTGVVVQAEGGQLRVTAPKRLLTSERKMAIKQHEAELLALLEAEALSLNEKSARPIAIGDLVEPLNPALARRPLNWSNRASHDGR